MPFFGFLDIEEKDYLIINHLLLIYKLYVYNARDSEKMSFNILKSNIVKIETFEEKLSQSNNRRKRNFIKKWGLIKNLLI